MLQFHYDVDYFIRENTIRIPCKTLNENVILIKVHK